MKLNNERVNVKMNQEQITAIITACDNLQADDMITITNFGKNEDLTLYIHKDCEYKPYIDEDKWNIVSISTKQNDTFVDDTNDIYVTDGSLYRELKRIYNYRNFKTL